MMEKGRNVTLKDKMCYRNIDEIRKGLATEIQGGNHFRCAEIFGRAYGTWW